MRPSSDPDGELVQKVQGGDRSAFDPLVLKYRHRIMGIASRILGDRAEAEDLAQDVFVKAFFSLKQFQGEALFSTWLYRITANSCLNHRRKRLRDLQLAGDLGGTEPIHGDGASNPHMLLEKKEFKAVLEKTIATLPKERRIVLILRDIEGLSYDDIADSLGLELGTVRSRLHRARLEIQESIKEIFSPGAEKKDARI